MKLGELWSQYQQYTIDVSGALRTLAFAAGGFVWVLRGPQAVLPRTGYAVLGGLVLYFLCDITQYIIGAVMRKRLAEAAEQRIVSGGEALTADADVTVNQRLDRPANLLWWIKIGVLGAVYVALGIHIACQGVPE